MKLVVYFPDELQVICCEKEDFLPEKTIDFDHLDDIGKDELLAGVCLYDEKPFDAILLQVYGL